MNKAAFKTIKRAVCESKRPFFVEIKYYDKEALS